MLRLEAVSKNYNHRARTVKALDDVSLDIPKGDWVSVVGPSGSGKSTFLLTLGGMLSPSSGRVLLDDSSLYDLSPDERALLRRGKIGFLFQTFNLVPYLTAAENVQIPLFLAGMSDADQVTTSATLLERVGLSDRIDHKPAELSVGQQQRVALARVLANNPSVILADEPTGNLDPETTGQIMGIISDINSEGRTIVMVTHEPQSARMAKRTLRLNAGRISPEQQ